jgi:hypothetical protein
MKAVLTFIAIILIICVTSCIRTRNEKARALLKYESDKKAFISNYGDEFNAFLKTLKIEKDRFFQLQEDRSVIFDYFAITNSMYLTNVQSFITKIKTQRNKIWDIAIDAEIKFNPDKNLNYVTSEIHDILLEDSSTNYFLPLFYEDSEESSSPLNDLLEFYSLLDRHRSLWKVEDGKFIFFNKQLRERCDVHRISFDLKLSLEMEVQKQ